MFRSARGVFVAAALLLSVSLCAAPAAAAVNQAPTLDAVPVQFAIEGASFQVPLAGHDGDGDPLLYSAEGLPAGLAIDRVRGVIAGTPATAGDSLIVVVVSDGWLTATTSFALHVADASSPVDSIVTLDPQTNYEGERVDLDVELLWNDTRDRQGRIDRPPVGVFSVENLPPGLKFSRKFGRIRGRIDNGAARGGPYCVTITLMEGNNLYNATFTWTVLR
ncbi:MAG TPA: Ig domain-containing protein [Vicinamibacterales bacterium]|nr:Ig domain-containing protein [Vicinamibacterales bacterium]